MHLLLNPVPLRAFAANPRFAPAALVARAVLVPRALALLPADILSSSEFESLTPRTRRCAAELLWSPAMREVEQHVGEHARRRAKFNRAPS